MRVKCRYKHGFSDTTCTISIIVIGSDVLEFVIIQRNHLHYVHSFFFALGNALLFILWLWKVFYIVVQWHTMKAQPFSFSLAKLIFRKWFLRTKALPLASLPWHAHPIGFIFFFILFIPIEKTFVFVRIGPTIAPLKSLPTMRNTLFFALSTYVYT